MSDAALKALEEDLERSTFCRSRSIIIRVTRVKSAYRVKLVQLHYGGRQGVLRKFDLADPFDAVTPITEYLDMREVLAS